MGHVACMGARTYLLREAVQNLETLVMSPTVPGQLVGEVIVDPGSRRPPENELYDTAKNHHHHHHQRVN
jgi:hypothetical protein